MVLQVLQFLQADGEEHAQRLLAKLDLSSESNARCALGAARSCFQLYRQQDLAPTTQASPTKRQDVHSTNGSCPGTLLTLPGNKTCSCAFWVREKHCVNMQHLRKMRMERYQTKRSAYNAAMVILRKAQRTHVNRWSRMRLSLASYTPQGTLSLTGASFWRSTKRWLFQMYRAHFKLEVMK